MSKALEDVVAERARQIAMEGWTPDHDDEHANGEMTKAAMAYCQAGSMPSNDTSRLRDRPPTYWPWGPEWWKPSTPRRDLVKAAALIVAEIERLDRMEKKDA